MSALILLGLALALAMDAFAVALAVGLSRAELLGGFILILIGFRILAGHL